MPRKQLTKKPLVEAILELRWNILDASASTSFAKVLTVPVNSLPDPKYKLHFIRTLDRLSKEYPKIEALPTTGLPESATIGLVQYRLRTAENRWPLIQLGLGVLTVNETENYQWDQFRERCERSIEVLFESAGDQKDFRLQSATLRYINAIDIEPSAQNVLKFLSEKLHVNCELPSMLVNDSRISGNPDQFSLQSSFKLSAASGRMTVTFALGSRDNRPAFLWDTVISTDDVPSEKSAFAEWLKSVHLIIEDWFFKLIEGELESSFA